MNPYEVLEACESASGATAKIKILQKHDTQMLRDICKNACDPFITFGVKKFAFDEEIAGHLDFDHDFGVIAYVLNELNRRSITGGNAQEAISKASKRLNHEQREVFSRIIGKDLKCGVSVGTLNKAFPGLIAVWQIQKAKNMDFDKVVYPCLAEIKENGRGNTAVINRSEVKHYSTNGRPNDNMDAFNKELIGIADGVPMVVFGEVRGSRGTGVEQYKESQSLGGKNADMTGKVFVIWDMMLLGEFNRRRCGRLQAERSSRLKDHVRSYQMNNDREDAFAVRFIKQYKINSKEQLLKTYDRVLRAGREGLIVKNLNATYDFKRCYNWMKLKEQNSTDLKICGVKEGKGKLKGYLGSVTVHNGDVKVDCPMGKGMSRDVTLKLWKMYQKDKKSIIGKIAEISYQNVTPDGSLFLPKCYAIRTDKDTSDKPKKKKKKK